MNSKFINIMKKMLLYPAFLLLFCLNYNLRAQNTGEEIFKSVCAACHTIKMGRKVGPDLSEVYQLRNNEWLIRFIQSSQKFIKSGDTAAIAIYNEYNKIPMPDNKLSDVQILSIIDYIKMSDKQATVSAKGPKVNDSLGSDSLRAKVSIGSLDTLYTFENTTKGRSLFYGYISFDNGASPCISCHNINDQSILGGGKLARDLTGAYIKLGSVGIKAILTDPPFPAMKTAMMNHNLSENEIQALTSLLKSVGDQKYSYKIRDSAGLFLFSLGFVFALLLLAVIYILYDNRKIPDVLTKV
jgi:mono/diheme cytochrome c family protein